MANMAALFDSLLTLLLPNLCLLCGQHCPGPLPLCDACDRDLPHLTDACHRCALPLAGRVVRECDPKPDTAPGESRLAANCAAAECGQCLQAPPPYERCIAAFTFQYPVDTLIRNYKYHNRLAAGALLAALLNRKLTGAYAGDKLPDLITAVPMHWRRLLGRGFNQAALVAGHVAKQLRLPVADLCRRTRRTAPQQGAGRLERLQNLRNVFRVIADVEGLHIALVDDVVTTGTTVNELTRTFKKAGAGRVDIWTIARTPDTF